MIAVTQDEIDEAVLIGKNAVYKLAAEIALERKYGGKTDCCTKRLKLIYTVLQPLLCVRTSLSSYIFKSLGTPGGAYTFSINNEVLFTYTAPAVNNDAIISAVNYANNQDTGYTFEIVTVLGQDVYGVKITGTCEPFVIKITNDKDQYSFYNSYGGYCLDCLDNDTVRKLISKIRAFCTT